jgi:hypothetical protein
MRPPRVKSAEISPTELPSSAADET